ncbi:uncharacterized protein LOC116296716 [Actinia tenebrosa]|uniref:Uncharacterized protein LOC116296716 n=1 Tax=Actinia tenebrosa TaxID=6105 RepID=A0A6P8HW48_ACTTE|nr:uncharacterized protein LOC116296716 [Actinia tenebrosa]
MQQFNTSQKVIKVRLLQNNLTFNVMSRHRPEFINWCIVASSSTLKVYTDGRLVHSSPINITNHGILIPHASELVFGGRVNMDGLVYVAIRRHAITNFNAWDKRLSDETIYSMSSFCHAQTGSLIVAWPELLARNNYKTQSAVVCVAAGKATCPLSSEHDSSFELYPCPRAFLYTTIKQRNNTLENNMWSEVDKRQCIGCCLIRTGRPYQTKERLEVVVCLVMVLVGRPIQSWVC